ncbi:methyltransferase protein [Trifolium repens]|nr:methyltransferase protein [Trifolium repens]
MCPLRFILVFFSTVLAGYSAWRTVSSPPKIDLDSDDSIEEEKSSFKKKDFDFKKEDLILKMIESGISCRVMVAEPEINILRATSQCLMIVVKIH